MTDEQPRLQLEFRHVLEPVHGEAFAAKWPDGYAQLVIAMLGEFFEDPETVAALGELTGTTFESAAYAKLNEYGPLCCRYPHVWRDVVEDSVTERAFCEVCGKIGPTVEYRMKVPRTEKTITYSHVCVECIGRAVPRKRGPAV